MKLAAILIAIVGMSSAAHEEHGANDSAIVPFVDHLVYATPDLEATVADLEKRLGVRAVYGGPHPGRGTRNALISLGPGRYLEIFSRDPSQPEPAEARPFGVDQLKKAKLVAWLAKGRDLPTLRERAASKGIRLGEVLSGSRVRPDGIQVSWQFTSPWVRIADGLIPSFIDWGASPHPSSVAAPGVELVDLRGEHPHPKGVRSMLARLNLPLKVSYAPHPALVAVLRTPKGIVELR